VLWRTLDLESIKLKIAGRLEPSICVNCSMRTQPKILFVLKKRFAYGEARVSFGLVNSCRFVVNALRELGIEAEIAEVIDGNGIDREVFNYKPTHCFIEALWATPAKMGELVGLHPSVKWFIRIHSNTPFLSLEGVAFDWILQYSHIPNVQIAANNLRLATDLACLDLAAVYAPNVYLPNEELLPPVSRDKTLRIGCFGAIRPFKNVAEQALAAITFANAIGKKLSFCVNANKFETVGEPILRNLRSIFKATEHQLIEFDWSNHQEFVSLVRSMDLGLQVSFTETYNIVAADFAANDIPVIGSTEIEWMSSYYQAKTTDVVDIVKKLEFAWNARRIKFQRVNRWGLEKANVAALAAWLRLINL
jgi:hypothetical protein